MTDAPLAFWSVFWEVPPAPMRPRSFGPFVVSLALLAFAAASGACNNQGPGDVCDVTAGNGGTDDCQSGLTCTLAPGALGSPNQYRCCPTGSMQQSGPAVCNSSSSTPGDASTAPPAASDASAEDAEPSDGATSDSGDASDASVADSASLASEAGADAPVEGAAAVDAAADVASE